MTDDTEEHISNMAACHMMDR